METIFKMKGPKKQIRKKGKESESERYMDITSVMLPYPLWTELT